MKPEPEGFRRHWPHFLLGVALLALCASVIRAPDLFSLFGADAEDETSRSSNQRQALLLLFGGILAAVTAWLSVLRHRREKQALQIERDRHWTSRYTEAVTQLGDESGTVNYGGVYALQRLALEAPEHDDAQMVANLLSAYVLETATQREQDFLSGREYNAAVPSILVAVFKSLSQIRTQSTVRLDFEELVLSDLPLAGVDLPRARFSRAQLMNAKFLACSFRHAWFHHTLLTSSDLRSSDFTGAHFVNARLSQTNLANANFQDSHLRGASLQRAAVAGAKFEGADLREADLSELEDWTGAQLEQAGMWDEQTVWPTGFTPSTQTKPHIES